MLSPSLTLLRTQSDERLVALAREGHERAFEAIVERYRRALLRGARRVLPEARAEDALQMALLNAWTALQRGDEVRDLRAWLYRIVHNCALNALRVAGYDYDELQDTLRITDAPGDELERRAVVRQTLTSLAGLPDRQREALLRTAIAGHSQEEVARDLGCPTAPCASSSTGRASPCGRRRPPSRRCRSSTGSPREGRAGAR
jgi:RNA polymerase sigma factor (sigma-70 family)